MDCHHASLVKVGVDEETDLHSHDDLLDWVTYWAGVTDLGVENCLVGTLGLEKVEDLLLEALGMSC